ncbi:MAG: CsgG/HfaB family protein [Victivallaceae bacterium]|nr:CsgG/HfaB family protein [Victivallaceae bacterium]
MKKTIVFLLAVFCVFQAAALERIAVAEPKAKGGLAPEEISGISDYLETRITGKYEIYSRSALGDLLKEYAFSDSGLTDDGKAQLAQKKVDNLLVYSVAKLGGKLSLTMMVVDCATGQVKPGERAAVAANDLKSLYGKLDVALDKMGLLPESKVPQVKSVAVLPPVPVPGVSMGAAAEFQAKLSSFLLKSGSFELLSREDLGRIAAETELSMTDLADAGQSAKLAQLKIADYLVIPGVTRFENRPISSGTAMAGVSTGSSRLAMQVRIKVIEVKTGTVIADDAVDTEMRSTDIPAESRRNWVAADYENAFMSKAAVTAGNYLLNRLDPVAVAAVENGSVYLSRGAGAGVFAGQTFTVFNPGKPVVHPKTGRVIGTAETKAGVVKVVSTLPDMSVAAIVDGGDMIKTGAICRPDAPSPADQPYGIEPAAPTPAPAYPMAE